MLCSAIFGSIIQILLRVARLVLHHFCVRYFVCCFMFSQAAELHEEARKRGKANVVTYSAAISACAREQRWKEALSLLSQMRKDVSKAKCSETLVVTDVICAEFFLFFFVLFCFLPSLLLSSSTRKRFSPSATALLDKPWSQLSLPYSPPVLCLYIYGWLII